MIIITSSDARDRYGVLPLRGKMLNVRVASAQQIADNKEIGEIAEALGMKSFPFLTRNDIIGYVRCSVV